MHLIVFEKKSLTSPIFRLKNVSHPVETPYLHGYEIDDFQYVVAKNVFI